MKRLSTKKEEKTMAFYVYHPCYCLEEIFKTFLRCLGIESTQTKEEKDSSTSLLKPHACSSDSNVALKDHYYSSSSNQKSSQDGVADPPLSTSTQTIVCIYLFIYSFFIYFPPTKVRTPFNFLKPLSILCAESKFNGKGWSSKDSTYTRSTTST